MDHQLFLVKEKKENAPSGHEIPRHPEYILVRKLIHNTWDARNKETHEIVTVTKEEVGDFYYYHLKTIGN